MTTSPLNPNLFGVRPAGLGSSFPEPLTEPEMEQFLAAALTADPNEVTHALVHLMDPTLLRRCLDAGVISKDTPDDQPSLLSVFTTTLVLRHRDGPEALLGLLRSESTRCDGQPSPLQRFLTASAQMDHSFFSGQWPRLLAAHQDNFTKTAAHHPQAWQNLLDDVRMAAQIIDLGFHRHLPSTPFIRPHLANLIAWADAGRQRQSLVAGLAAADHLPAQDRSL